MKKIIYIILFVMLSSPTMAQFPFFMNLRMQNDYDQEFDHLYFGVYAEATDSIDASLGEKEYPDLGFPSGIFHAYFHIPAGSPTIAVYKDFRGIPDEDKFMIEHSIHIYRGYGETVYFEWDELPAIIDSAKLIDKSGYLVINMKDSTHGTVPDAWARDWMYLKVWYNKNPSSVVEQTQSNIEVFPNPCVNTLNINSPFADYRYKIYNIYGKLMLQGKSIDENLSINVDILNFGVYYIYISNDRFSKTMKFIKI